MQLGKTFNTKFPGGPHSNIKGALQSYRHAILDFNDPKITYDEDLIRFCLNLALEEGAILRISVGWYETFMIMIDAKLDKCQIQETVQNEKILSSIRSPLVGEIINDIPDNEAKGVKIIVSIRIFKEGENIRYHTRAKGRDVGKTYIKKGILTKSITY